MATSGEKEIKRDWPHITGLELADKHEGRTINMQPQGLNGVKTTVLERDRGLI